jgi:nucleotide-binding universal stress UspA family protein
VKKILVAIDLSPSRRQVVAQATALARSLGGPLWLLHVAAPDPAFVGYAPGPQVVRDSVAHEFRDEHREIQELADELRASGLEATALLVQGPTAATILAEADRLGVDLIVMGSHGYGALQRALLGSVSEGVLRGTTRPVVIVPVGASRTKR